MTAYMPAPPCPRCRGQTCTCHMGWTTGVAVSSGSYIVHTSIFVPVVDWVPDGKRMLLALTAPAPPVVIEPKSFAPPARPRPSSWLTKIARRRC